MINYELQLWSAPLGIVNYLVVIKVTISLAKLSYDNRW
jgi:hypothetical protein